MQYCIFTGLSCKMDGSVIESPIFGRYTLDANVPERKIDKEKAGSYLCYNLQKDSNAFYVLTDEKHSKLWDHKDDSIILLTNEDIATWYPKKFSEKIDKILLYLGKQSKYVGDTVFLPTESIGYIFLMHNCNPPKNQQAAGEWDKELAYIWRFLVESGYVKVDRMTGADHGIENHIRSCATRSDIHFSFVLTPKAWQRIDELQKTYQDTKQVFIAMSFDKSLDDANVAIQKAITNNGYLPRRMDEYRHNNQIVPEMLYQIRQSLFVVADLTGHNNGAYYEAGYAAGLGKTVILTCREDSFKDGTHFDVKQQATVIWKDENDLQDKLTTWIEATIGKAQ